MARSPCISIVTPSFGQGKYLGDALDSVAAQVYEGGITHIIIDGGSTDGTVDLLSSRPEVTWVSEPDRGQSDALNKGFGMAAGEIIGWLNSDDFYLPGALQAVADEFAKQPGVDVIYGDCLFVDESARLTRAKFEHAFDLGVLTNFGCYIPSTAAFFRRSLLDSGLLRLDDRCRYVMDYELFMRLAASSVRFGYLQMPLAAFRWHDGNMSSDAKARWGERLRVQSEYVADLSPLRARLLFSYYRAKHLRLKMANGSLAIQRGWRSRRGEQMRWWMP